MKILMATNTYLPHVGGVARSVETFCEFYRKAGHQVLVLAPEFEGIDAQEVGVVRIPAIQNFNGSDFSVRLPVPHFLYAQLNEFEPDIVHSHHPFLLGDTALRIAKRLGVPIVFTHHTMYESYTHYVPGDSGALRRFVKRLATGYANLCDHVIAPSESIARILTKRGVGRPITAIPTGIDFERFSQGAGEAFREQHGIPSDAFVVGHVGRLALEKNLPFLGKAVAGFLKKFPSGHFLVVGEGPSSEAIETVFSKQNLRDRLHLCGRLSGQELIDSYHAMDVFAFASKTETQGMVLAEAMCAGTPVVALDAPGAREVVNDGSNGKLLSRQSARDFRRALSEMALTSTERMKEFRDQARQTGREYSAQNCAQRSLAVYASCLELHRESVEMEGSSWEAALRLIELEWDLVKSRTEAVGLRRSIARAFSPKRLAVWVRRALLGDRH